METVEHQRIEKLCRCDIVTTGVFPAEVKCAVSYGPRLHAIGAYLINVHYLPVTRTAAVFKDLFQLPVSTGWVSSLGQKTSGLLAETVVLIKQAVTASAVAHVDETGLRVGGGLAWVHCAGTTTHTVFHIDAKRGLAGTLNGGVLQSFTGVMVHDGWEPCKTFTAATHGLCNAHHLRELQKISEDTPELGWAKQMAEFLLGTHRQVQTAKARGDTGLSKDALEAVRQGYAEILTTGDIQSPARVPLAYLAAYDAHHAHHAQVIGRCAPTTGIAPFTALVEQVMTCEPYASARRVFWVVDNGSSHAGAASIQRMNDAFPNATLVHLPVHASWLNQVEIYFFIVQRKIVKPQDFENLDILEQRLLAFPDRYNASATPFDWRFGRAALHNLLARIDRHQSVAA